MTFPLRARLGTNLIEVLVAATVAGTVLMALGGFIASTFRAASTDRDYAFAMQKALQMMEEVSAYKPANAGDSIDKFGQEGFMFTLTTEASANAYRELSGNPNVNGRYKFCRKINVEQVPGDPYARKVTVTVYLQNKKNASAQPDPERGPLAVVSNVLRSSIANVGPRQVIDLFVISIENLPHVFRKNDDDVFYPSPTEARRLFKASLDGFKASYSGLDFNVRYISRLSIGRDDYYRPYINAGMALEKDPDSSKRDPLNKVYFYPGVLGQDVPDAYYDPAFIDGRVAIGNASAVGADAGGAADSYPLADQFNHPVTYAEEFDATPATGGSAVTLAMSGAPKLPPTGTQELSLRQFLEDLLQDTTGKYRNAVIVNLHGDLLPALALRNYADAARDFSHADALMKERRIVTHPWKLSTPVTEPVRLLTHTFFANGAVAPSPPTSNKSWQCHLDTSGAWTAEHAARDARIVVRGLKPYLQDASYDLGGVGTVNQKDVKVTAIQRTRSNSGNERTAYSQIPQWPAPAECGFPHSGPHVGNHAAGTDHEPGHSASHGSNPKFGDADADPETSADDLIIEINELDFDARRTDDNGTKYGIDHTDLANYGLHRLLYFPDPLLPFLDSASGWTKPRNTARLIVEFPLKASAAGKRFEVVTQLKTTTGFPTLLPPATSLESPATSRTWIYAGNALDWDATNGLYWDATSKSPLIPWTDQVQLVGDPRHNPYYDVRKRGLFNPYWTDFTDTKEVYKGIPNSPNTDSAKYAGTANVLAAFDAPPLDGVYVDTKFDGTRSSWNDVKFNAPAYFRMWREALLRNDALFVNVTGEPIRYLGLGGEFSLEKKVNGLDLTISKKPYDGSTSDAGAEANELFGDAAPWIERQDSAKWYAKPWLGELYPSDTGTSWLATGNLPTGSASTDFRRSKIGDLDSWSVGTDKTNSASRKGVAGEMGLPAFLNAEKTVGSSGPLDVDKAGGKGTQTLTFKDFADQIKQSLLTGTKSDVGYNVTGATTSDQPPEWSSPVYTALRAKMDWLDATKTPEGYYAHDAGAGYFAASPIQVFDATGSSPRRAIVFANAQRPDNIGQVSKMLDIAIVGGMGAFFDGTNVALGLHNVKPLPRVKIKAPANGATAAAAGTVPVEFYAKWGKVDGNEYTPNYTYNGAAAPGAGGPLPVKYFLKYENTGAAGWKFQDGTATEAGKPPAAEATSLEIAHVAYPSPINTTWDPPALGLSPGEYRLRIEGFRKDGTRYLPLHHTYHEINVTLQ